jgi:hypothetical protein
MGLVRVVAVLSLTLSACVTAPGVFTAPVPTTPAVLTRAAAARLVVLVQGDGVTDPERPKRAVTMSQAVNAVASALSEAGFRVTTDPGVASSVVIKVASDSKPHLRITAEAKGIILEQVDVRTEQVFLDSEFPEVGKHIRQRFERSEALASLAAELASKPQVASGDQGRPWAKTTGTAATRRLAVLEFRGSLAPNLLALLSDQARSAAVEAVRPHGIAVMTRENTAVMLKDQGKAAACMEGECEVETARLIGAHLVVTGEVSRVGSAQFLQMKLFDAEAGTLLASKQADAADDLALVKAAKPAAAALFE